MITIVGMMITLVENIMEVVIMRKIWFGIAVALVFAGICFAQTDVSGDVSGVWDMDGSPYYITGEVRVPTSDSLRIMPGVEVIFQGKYQIGVDALALFRSIGTVDDSITFTASDTSEGHHGIFFNSSAEGCIVAFCIIEYVHKTPSYHAGGAIYCVSSSPIICNNTFRYTFK